MNRCALPLAAAGTLLVLGTLGCQMPKMDLDEMLKPPPRPAELDQLAAFVGTWEGSSEGKMAGTDEACHGHGTSTTTWDADKWILVERMDYTLRDKHKMSGIGIWRWDPAIKKFRTTWFDNYGGTAEGTAWFDSKAGAWRMKTKSRWADGMTSVGEGTIRFTDSNTMEWQMSEWNALKTMKFMEMNGTSKRK